MQAVEHFIKQFVPEHYDLFLDLSRETKTFSGKVTITGQAQSDRISLHQKDLEITSVEVAGQARPFTVDHDNESLHIELDEAGQVELVIAFSGKITDNMTGIYPSYYTVDGVKKEVLSTQFESHFAREAFPCVDEPEAKATFDLALRFDQVAGELALSNMPETDVENRKETGIWKFETTPRMSSYLLAFVAGDLQGVTAKTKNGTLVGVYSTKAHPLSNLDFSLDIAVRSIEFYEDYYGVKYPIPQSLHIALPDFSAGAMENWGLVTYREVYLVVDENSTFASRQQVALVVAHELAHQWFGNLVTMKWWDDLWLNESFANMMEYVCVDAIEPSWNIFEDFQTGGVPAALKRDATDGVQSVHVEVKHPDEINTLFDGAIVYAKGSRLMHMLRRWLGDADFAKGLHAYFEKHQYSNTIGRDLWNALGQASGRDVAAFMDSWLEQPGYPVLTVKVENDVLKISQKQFFIGEHEDKNRLWVVPLNSNWKGLPDTLETESIEIPGYAALLAENEGALRLNTENTAHYITDYQGDLLEAVLAELERLDNTSKLQIVQERRLLAEAGHISYADLLPVLDKLAKEESYLVVSAVSQVISALERFIDEGTETEKAFNTLVAKLACHNYDRLGFEAKDGESDEDELVRQLTISMMIRSNDAEASQVASQIFAAHKDNLAGLPAAIRAQVLINEMKHHETKDLVATYLDLYTHTTDAVFKRQLAAALAYSTDADNIQTLIRSWKDKFVVKPQDLSAWYYQFLDHQTTQETVWVWARENWAWIKAALGGDMSFDSFVILPAHVFKTEQRLAEYKEFFEPQLSDLALSRNIRMGIKDIAARVDLIKREKAAVETVVAQYAKA
ncbi:M1 family metallopeptidase [Streptococcus oralis]|uniref:M1 family metallopeptidase n=1 Tax=Streptococcus oralis TaxID=1303 RepID=UPI0020C897E6|nr:M1 family metallopeptidase [Streptococcus oralis]MCP9036953.1 M1 family metallopeptidase [Streptococcus oralis]MCP9052059.1 M1 family metallopeptidase [Streptococcus oralis]MCP9058766.1 M1 family metallopeptidase [Streptococcus oralis]MCP9065658.1 M1 family metallopeptidase [Streptococcus oralis]MCP9069233.1 M1 family metallopeptidase [Streptococcus oralis]